MMKSYPANLMQKITLFVTIVLSLAIFYFVPLFVSIPAYFRYGFFLFLVLLVLSVTYSALSEIDIDEMGIAFCNKLFNVNKKILWNEIVRVSFYMGKNSACIVIHGTQETKITISALYAEIEDLLDQINRKYPIENYQKVVMFMSPKSFWNLSQGLLLILLTPFLIWYLFNHNGTCRFAIPSVSIFQNAPAETLQPGWIDVPLHPALNFNGMSREGIFELRRKLVNQIAALAPPNYQPSRYIFGRIQDGKPWWGMLGMCYYGNGPRSILGDSKESRFIANPYLLAGVAEFAGHRLLFTPFNPAAYYPKPHYLTWRIDAKQAQVTYNLADYYRKAFSHHFPDSQDLYLYVYNAHDLGFNFFAIDPDLSLNIAAVFNRVLPLDQWIQLGQSCGYPGGCNNTGSYEPYFHVRWNKLPARIYIKLWKGKVSDASQKADMGYTINLY